MWLVLCSLDDVPALWAYVGLKNRGLEPLELVSSEMLAYSLRWVHRLSEGEMSLEFTLADGRTMRSDMVQGVLNRLLSVPQEHLLLANIADREYAIQELTAFFMSWLYTLPQPVLNRPTSQGLSGQWRHISEWIWMAAQVGLPTPNYRQTSYDQVGQFEIESKHIPISKPVKTVIVVGQNVVGASVPPHIQKGCRHLAELAETAVLGIEFTIDAVGRWCFADATPFPDLRLGGSALLDTLASVLRGE